MKNIVILGSTGSIGTNTLDIVDRFPQEFRVVGLTAGSNDEKLEAQIRKFRPAFAALANEAAAARLRDRCTDLPVKILAGDEGVAEVAQSEDAELVISAIVGGAGLLPTLAAIRAGKQIALANKEPMVMAGALMQAEAKKHHVRIFPIDSEHSAIFQSLEGHRREDVKRIILTASGGPFRRTDPLELRHVTPQQACAHPNWVMGRKISVDSATMMNKALEVIEARFLFGVASNQIEVVIHPQSVIHSMVQYKDNSVVAQLGTPDMKVPIAYGLSWPDRMASGAAALDFRAMADMTFESLDSHGHKQRFPGLQLAWSVLEAPSGSTAVLNAANEVAVAAFLDGKIRFDQIHGVNLETLESVATAIPQSLEDLLALDALSRDAANRVVGRVGV